VRGDVTSFEELARQNRVTSPYVRRVFRGASIAPQLVESIAREQPFSFHFEKLPQETPLDWPEQENL
jgi:hypothetical protein